MSENKDDRYLVGKLLIAMPGMTDPRFHRSVIYVCAHDEQGAMGLVVNQKIPGIDFDQLLAQMEIVSDIEIDLGKLNVPVMHGGPVENSRGFLLHSSDFNQPDTITVDDKVSVTGTIDALKEVTKGQGPDDMLFILGYAGWSEGQLDQEIQQNSWLVTDADPELVFRADVAEKWALAVQKLGIDPGMLSSDAGRA